MELRAGTSGYSYKEWKGVFYPERLSARDMLGFYSQHFSAVEINQTFYRLPTQALLASWAAQVPESFRFAIKAPRRITHFKRLKGVEDETAYLVETLQTLGPRLGVLLVQLPPDFAWSGERLAAFLALLPRELPVAFEFRHPSWSDAATRELLGERDITQVASDLDLAEPELDAGAGVGYLRLRRDVYRPAELTGWAQRIRAQRWHTAFAFFKHEREGPERALALTRAFAQAAG
jgi:uncharacterized protein YecE (DUF72 family)